MNRASQIASLRNLHEVRERTALLALQEQQRVVAALQQKCTDIQQCAESLQRQINELDHARCTGAALTVEGLLEEAKHRDILERDLRRERFFLDNVYKDFSQANENLSCKRSLWCDQHNRIDALDALARG